MVAVPQLQLEQHVCTLPRWHHTIN